MLKRILLIALLMTLMVGAEPWSGGQFTMTSGTARRVVATRTIVSSLYVQMKEGSSTGIGYLLFATPEVDCVLGGAGTTLITELSPSTTTAPGGDVTIPSNSDPAGGINAQNYCIQAAHTGDVMVVSMNIRN